MGAPVAKLFRPSSSTQCRAKADFAEEKSMPDFRAPQHGRGLHLQRLVSRQPT
jgi:hypothetical protein